MNHPAPANSRYKPTCYEHAANCYTHAVSTLLAFPIFFLTRCFNTFLWVWIAKCLPLPHCVRIYSLSGFVRISVNCNSPEK